MLRTVTAALLVSVGCGSSVANRAPACPEPVIAATEEWRHDWGSAAASALGDAHHAGTDPVVSPGQDALVGGKFAYGAASKDLQDEDVTLLLRARRCGPWKAIATARTDDDGRASFAIPASALPGPGRYDYRAVVHGDRSSAAGTVFVVAPGTRAVVFDIDGTLTTSDAQLAKQVVGADADMRPGANQVARAYADAGYLPIYITGRPYLLRADSRVWLDRRDFPPGILITTDSLGDSMPGRDAVGAFKLASLKQLLDTTGLDIRYAYGNATTDVCAYAEAGIAPAVTYIVGDHAGTACDDSAPTRPLTDYRQHLKNLPIK